MPTTSHCEFRNSALAGAIGVTDLLAAATDLGGLYLWELGSAIRLVDNRSLAPSRVTALAWANADVSLLVGDELGGIAAFFRVRLRDDDPEPSLVRAHVYEKQSAAVVDLVPSVRDKSFLAVGRDGSLRLLHRQVVGKRDDEIQRPVQRVQAIEV